MINFNKLDPDLSEVLDDYKRDRGITTFSYQESTIKAMYEALKLQ